MSSGDTYGSLSSHSKSKRKIRVDAFDRDSYNVGQSLVTVVNDPRAGDQRGLFNWAFPQDDGKKDVPAPLDPLRYPAISRQDLEGYLKVIRGRLDRFAVDRQQIHDERLRSAQNAERAGFRNTSGEGLVQAMQLVPSQYFQEDFSLNKPETIKQLFNFEDESDIRQRISELNGHLDVVESQLLKEIAARSQSFFEAATSLHELRTLLCDTLSHIKSLRQQMSEMDKQTYQAAVSVTNLQRRRRNLHNTQEHLKSLEEVVVSRRALDCFMDSRDYAGTLELLENMRHTLDQQTSAGLACFKRLPPQIKEMISVVEALLAHEFLSTARYPELDVVVDLIVSDTLDAMERSRVASGDEDNNNNFSASSHFLKASHHTPLLFANSSTPSIPSSNSTSNTASNSINGLTSSSGTAFGMGSSGRAPGTSTRDPDTPLWALPLPPMSDDMREHLHDRLLPLVVGLYRQNVLAAAVAQLNDAVCGDIKTAVNSLLDKLLPALLQKCHQVPVPPDVELTLSDKLQMLDHPSFLYLLQAVLRAVHTCALHMTIVSHITEDILQGVRTARSVLMAVGKDFTGLRHSILEVAQGRWIKLVAARTQVHQRLKLYQFKELLAACECFGEYIEQQGAKPSANFKMSTQVQCKAHLDAMHSRCTTQLQHVLEAESWAAVEVPASFQDIIDRILTRAPRPSSPTRAPGAPALGILRQGSSHNPPGETSASSQNGTSSSPKKAHSPKKNSSPRKSNPSSPNKVGGSTAPDAVEPGGNETSHHHSNGVGGGNNSTDGEKTSTSSSGIVAPGNVSISNGRTSFSNGVLPSSHALLIAGKEFHAVNASLILLKLLEEYLLLYDAVPLFGAEIAQKVVDLLRDFNFQTSQLVLGAGAMKTAGLKSISAKHLALSCQCLGGVAALHPFLRASLISNVSPPWKALLLPAFDQLLQDITTHIQKIHAKLVSIMQDRLQASTRHLAQEAEMWGTLYLGTQPSEAVRLMTKQLMTLNQVLSPILLPEEVKYIFSRVATLYSEALADTLDSLPPRGEQWELQRRCNAQYILQVFRELPLEPSHASAHLARLTTFYTKHYGSLEPSSEPALPVQAAPVPA